MQIIPPFQHFQKKKIKNFEFEIVIIWKLFVYKLHFNDDAVELGQRMQDLLFSCESEKRGFE